MHACCNAGAVMAVDGNEATYWASKFDDTKEPVALTIDLGGKSNIQDMRIDWEFPAKAFTVLVSIDGKKFVEAYSTDVNALKSSRLLIGRSASAVKIVMREPHAARGRFEGHTLYGIASVSVFGGDRTTTASPLPAQLRDVHVCRPQCQHSPLQQTHFQR